MPAASTSPVLRGLLVAALVLLLLLALLWGFQRRLVFLPAGDQVPPAATALPGARDVTLTTQDGLALGEAGTCRPPPAAPSSSLPATRATGPPGRRWPQPSASTASGCC